ncbi:MAG: FtsX-like permease family protein [Bacteroidales bacterium]|jgi:ABC-type lipoprotein release transport system permease subunit|nr:FtsX-like permease family protein [Bacteroidales bacterium]
MKEIIKIAWKNVWRNKKRSVTVVVAVILGISAGIFACGVMQGWVEQRIDAVIYIENGRIKLYNPDFLNNEEINNVIPNKEAVEHFLNKETVIKAFSERVKLMAMATTSRGSTSLMLQGINIDDEKKVSKLYTCLLQGTYFEEETSRPVLISDKTAEQLRIKNYVLTTEILDSLENTASIPNTVIASLRSIENIRFESENKMKKEISSLLDRKDVSKYGFDVLKMSEQYRLRSKIVFTFTDKQGELVNQIYKVCGVYKTANIMYDQSNAFVLKSDLSTIAGLNEGEIHETGIILRENANEENVQSAIKKAFPELSVLTWKELSPDASLVSEYMSIYLFIFVGIILFALAFGIINTMLMAILERTKELGMLMAIGMNRKRVFSMIMLETVFLTMAGAVAGMLAGWLLIQVTGMTGLNFSSFVDGFEAMGWAAIVYPTIDLFFFFGITVLVIVTGVLSSIIPARKALSLNPVEAIRMNN